MSGDNATMKTVILAGGMGSRLAEETRLRPKPMVEIGGKPMLWHIMKIYAAHGHSDFVVALGYMGEYIKDYFSRFFALNGNLSVDLGSGEVAIHDGPKLDWKIDLIDTGVQTMTGGRVRRLNEFLGNQSFMLTYGDGLADVDIQKLIAFHKSHGKLVTVTAVRPPARFGSLQFEGDRVTVFAEKPQAAEGWINGGFFVMEPGIFEFLKSDADILERTPLESIAAAGELMAYRHEGFWQPMDTLREKQYLMELWESGDAPWKVW